jgi:hypothetical protein
VNKPPSDITEEAADKEEDECVGDFNNDDVIDVVLLKWTFIVSPISITCDKGGSNC